MEHRLKTRYRAENLMMVDGRARELLRCTARTREVFFQVTGAKDDLPAEDAEDIHDTDGDGDDEDSDDANGLVTL